MPQKQRLRVWNGDLKKTSGGLTKTDLFKNKRGKIVSKKRHDAGVKRYYEVRFGCRSIKRWCVCFMLARAILRVKGFVPIKKGTPLYRKVKETYVVAAGEGACACWR